MRELSVRIRFTLPCLGKHRQSYRSGGKVRHKFVLRRTPNGQLVFLPTWWQAIMVKAARLMSRHQGAVRQIMFAPEVDGTPAKELFDRYYDPKKFSRHEVFAAGSEIGVTCAVPDEISDSDFIRLLSLAGQYYGISPARPNEFGRFEVVSVQRRGAREKEE